MPLKNTPAWGLIIILLATLSLSAASASIICAANDSIDPSYVKEIEKWRRERIEEINGENGWNTLVGLFWLHQGRNRFGSDPSNDIVLPADRAPKFGGSLWLLREQVRMDSNSTAHITHLGRRVRRISLLSDANGKPTIVSMGSLTFFVIKRGDKFGLRIKDKHHPARRSFQGLDYFQIDPGWRIEAKLEPHVPHKVIPIANVLGMVDDMISPGALAFSVDGKTFRLEPVLEKGSKQFFLIFGDATNGKETYGAGRYLYVDPPDKDGRVIIDFNKAYNPPCAFTKFATCPLPPRQNRLSIRVEAGEKKYAGSEH
jgi:uncharacterized protein (DUF1684 family)